MPLGLESSEQLDNFWSQNSRRRVFYSYPNGTAPLTGFLSLADPDNTSHPQYGWNEERWIQRRTVTITGPTANNVFYTAGGAESSGNTFTPTAGTTYRMYVYDADQFQLDDMVKVHNLNIAATSVRTEISGLVVTKGETVGTGDYIEIKVIASAEGAVTNNSATLTVGLPVVHAGSAFAEGSRSRTGRYRFPSEIFNYTQIFKTAWEMTGTALKEPTKYDKTGDYKNQLKKNGIDHLAGMEWAFLFGDRRTEAVEDPDTGSTVRRGYVGGALWFLKQWEKGSVGNGGAFDYRENATDVTAQTDYRAYPDKRIIRLGSTSISKDDFEAIEALPFERTNSTEFCKLCLCGPGYIGKVNARYGKDVQVTQLRGEQYEGWDFKMTKRTSLTGDVYYKMHPLFNNPEMRNSAFYIDLGYIKYRPMEDRDTDIMPLIQLPDADKRKDQYLTEAGLEFPYPEAHMFVGDLGSISL
jgi:hypothetical protein